jgi:4-amino-4-deoxy-L-arabinose transferase-like glycosyltransferase
VRRVREAWAGHFAGSPPAPLGQGTWLFPALLAAVAAVLVFPDNQPLMEPDEGRHAEVAREMLVRGDWVVPYLQDAPYYQKPPLQYWLTAAAYAVFGVQPWAARLAPAVSTWLTALLTYFWARRPLGKPPAFLAGIMLCLSLQFIILGRTVLLDGLLTLWVTASWYAAHTALASPVLRWRWWLSAGLACGVGILAKGPVALLLVAPPVVGFALLTRKWPGWLAWGLFAGLAVLVPSPWYAAMAVRDPDYLDQFFWRANVLRYVQPFDHEQPWWFYLPVLFLGTFPWSLVGPAATLFLVSRDRGLAGRRTPALGFCVLAAGWTLVFFSTAGCKSPPYLLPALGPLALWTGTCLETVLSAPAARSFRLLGHAAQALPCHAAVAVLLLGAATYATAAGCGWLPWREILLPLAVAPALGLVCWSCRRRLRPRTAWAVCAAAGLAFGLFPLRDVRAGFTRRHSPLAAVDAIQGRPGNARAYLMSVGRVWYSASFYLNRTIEAYHGPDPAGHARAMLETHDEVLILIFHDEDLQALEDGIARLPAPPPYEIIVPPANERIAVVAVRRPEAQSP